MTTDENNSMNVALQECALRLQALCARAEKLRNKLQADSSLARSMERLAEEARNASPQQRNETIEYPQDDGFYLSDGWEIALINEEGD